MGLKCSMFGHRYGDPEVERDREEDGDEVVVTVREIKVCSRCGAESVVSENKEVTTLREPSHGEENDIAETADDGVEDGETPPEPDEPTTMEPPPDDTADATSDDAELLGEDDPVFEESESDDVAEDVVAAPPADADAAEEPPETPAADDEGAAIIDAESGDPPRASGDDAETSEDPPVADPEDLLPDDATPGDGSEEAADPEPPAEEGEPMPPGDAAETGDAQDREDAETDDGVILDEAEEPNLDRSHGEWPESDDVGPPTGDTDVEEWPADAGTAGGEGRAVTEAPPEADAETETGTEADAVDTGIASAGRAPSPDSATDDDRGAELFCPSCSYTVSLERASLRVGDICPECKRGYLSER